MNVNTVQHCRAFLKLTNNQNMKMLYLYMHVTNVNIRQHDRTSFRITNNLNTEVFNINVTSVNIRQQHRDFLKITTIYFYSSRRLEKGRYNKPLYNGMEGGY